MKLSPTRSGDLSIPNLAASDPTDSAWFLARVVSRGGAITSFAVVVVGWSALPPWRLGALLAIIIALTFLPVIYRLSGRSTPSAKTVFAGFALAQIVFIGATGGAASPFIVTLIPPAILIGVLGLREVDWMIPVMIAMLLGFLLLELGGPMKGVLPAAMLGGERPVIGYALFVGLLSGMVLVGFRIGRMARGRIEEANAEVLAAQQDRMAALARGNSDLFALTGAVAHELKNPLTTLLSLTSHLHKRSARYQLERETQVMLEEVRRMRRRVDELLNLSRPADELAFEQVDLQALVAEAARAHESLAAEAGVGLEVETQALSLRGDPRKLRQVLDNLVQNSLEASPRGAGIWLQLQVDGADAQLAVVDEGAGLSDALKGRLFKAGSTTKPTGSGIGLVISRAIVEQHGGTLKLESRDSGGCRATMTLPLVASSVATAAAHSPRA